MDRKAWKLRGLGRARTCAIFPRFLRVSPAHVERQTAEAVTCDVLTSFRKWRMTMKVRRIVMMVVLIGLVVAPGS
jgi:hypothetical protein